MTRITYYRVGGYARKMTLRRALRAVTEIFNVTGVVVEITQIR
jgi:hypothetical protein